jgi:hypothetical protein
VKPWPRLKLKYWPNNGVMAICNNSVICRMYRKRVIKRDVWQTCKDGQLHGFNCPVLKKTVWRADTWSTSLYIVSSATLTCKFFGMKLTFRNRGKNNGRLEVIRAVLITKIFSNITLRRFVNIYRSIGGLEWLLFHGKTGQNEQWRIEGCLECSNPPHPKFRSFDKAESNSIFDGKYIRSNLIGIWVSFICILSETPD